MRLIPRHRHPSRAKWARIAITEAEISADLHYPAPTRHSRDGAAARRAASR